MTTTVCYLGGFGRSGSTLLERMLAAATGSCALGEVVWLWDRGVMRDERCGCGERFSRCPFWLAVGDLAFGGWSQADARTVERLRRATDRTRNIPRLAIRRAAGSASGEYSEYLARVYAAATEVSGSSVVIDSSKHPSTAYNLRLNPRVRLKVVQMVRDSRGVAYSWTKSVARPEAADGAPGSNSMMRRYSPWMSALLWDAENLALTVLNRSGVPVLRLTYEQFLRAPAIGIERVGDLLETPVNLSELFVDERTVQLPPAHQISGNPMRFTAGCLTLREDNEWRAAFPPQSRRLVSVLTAPLLAHYGYLNSKREGRRQRRLS